MTKVNRIYHNKLVRDNIPSIIKGRRKECEVIQITDTLEFQQELFKKIKEEADALTMTKNKEDFLDKYADLMMVLNTIMRQLEITTEEMKEVKQENNLRKGAFKHQQFLRWSDDVDYETTGSPHGIPL